MRLFATLATLAALAPAARADETHPTPPPAATSSPQFAGPPPELLLGAAQLAMPDRQDLGDEDHDDRPSATAAAYGQLVAGSHGVGLGVGAAAAMMGISCDLANASVQGLVHTDRDAPAVGVARWDLCLDIGIFLRYSGDRGIGLAPGLAARRSLWRRAYDERYDRVEFGIGPLWFDGHANHYSIFHMAFGHGETHQSDGDAQRRIVDLDLDVALFTYQHARAGSDVQVDAIVMTNEALKAGDSDLGAVTSAFYPVRARADFGRWFADAHVGWQWAGGVTTQSGSTEVNGKTVSSWSETVDARGLPAFEMIGGEATAGVRAGPATASATLSRQMYPTFDGDLAVEARASGTLALALGPHRGTTVALSPFVARTHTWTRDDGDSLDTSAGAQLRVGHPLPHDLHLDAIGEAGRSPYARLDGGRAPNNAVGGQVLVALSARKRAVRPPERSHDYEREQQKQRSAPPPPE